MAYTKKTWKNGEVITEAGLNNMEEGIAEALALKDHVNNVNNPHGVTPAQIGAAPMWLKGTTDMTAGSSPLADNQVYFRYE